MQEAFEFLKQCGVFYLATVEEDQPRVRPFGAINVFEDKIYFQTGKVKKVADQLKKNPKIEISGMAKGSWIRLAGEAILDERIEAQEAMLEANPGLKKMYAAGDGNTEVYFIRNASVDICGFGVEPKHFEF